MSELAWPIVFLVFILVGNYRLGQYLNPPLEEAFFNLKYEYEKNISEVRREVLELKSKANALMIDRGFK